jgi:hypothetical protein
LTSANYRGTVIAIGRTKLVNILAVKKQPVIIRAPVTSAVEAVRAAIVQEFRSLEPTEES